MDSAPSVSPVPAAAAHADTRLSRLAWLLIVVAFAAYGWLLARHVGAYAGGSDSSGYMNHARLLGSGHVHVPPRPIAGFTEDPWTFSALGFKPAPDGNGLVPTYPTGLPLMVLAAAKVVGWNQAGNVVLWLHAMAGALLVFAAGRAFGLSRRVALIGTVIVAGSPVYLDMGLQAMSDVPALVWTTAAISAAWLGRKRTPLAAVAGFAYAMAVLIRPTNALALVPIAVALGFSWRRWLAFGAAGLPGAVFFCLHSHAAYGKFLTTGYGDSAGLDPKWVGVTLAHYARWLPVELTPAVVAFLALPWLLRRAPHRVSVLLAWVVVFAGFYSAYECTHETWWYLRFLLPVFPALAIGALLVLQHLVRSWRPAPVLATVVLCVGLVSAYAWNAHWVRKFDVLKAGIGEAKYPRAAEWLNQHLPPDAVVAAMQQSGALYYYTHFAFVRWDGLDAAKFAKLTAAVTAAHRPLYAILFPFEVDEQHALTQHMPGAWTKVGNVDDVTVWRWSPAP